MYMNVLVKNSLAYLVISLKLNIRSAIGLSLKFFSYTIFFVFCKLESFIIVDNIYRTLKWSSLKNMLNNKLWSTKQSFLQWSDKLVCLAQIENSYPVYYCKHLLCILTLNITTSRIMTFSTAINKMWHSTGCCYSEYHYAECRKWCLYAECRYAECLGADIGAYTVWLPMLS